MDHGLVMVADGMLDLTDVCLLTHYLFVEFLIFHFFLSVLLKIILCIFLECFVYYVITIIMYFKLYIHCRLLSLNVISH